MPECIENVATIVANDDRLVGGLTMHTSEKVGESRPAVRADLCGYYRILLDFGSWSWQLAFEFSAWASQPEVCCSYWASRLSVGTRSLELAA